MHTAQGLGTIAAMRPRLSWVQSAQTLVGPARAPVLRKNKTRVVEKKQKHTHVRTMHSGAGSTGWLEREAAGNPERTSGHLGSRDVRSHKKKLFLNLSNGFPFCVDPLILVTRSKSV